MSTAHRAEPGTARSHHALRDLETGKQNHDIYWTFTRGSKVKIRIRNDTASTHPMPHPIHFHGQRFLIAAVKSSATCWMAATSSGLDMRLLW